jgi:hypothetical protein
MTAREYFENYMRQQNACVRLARQSFACGGAYRTVSVERAWQLWHAAWMASNYEAKKPGGASLMGLPVINPYMLEVGK